MRGPFIDQIEGKQAVLIIDGQTRKVPRSSLPKGAKEGDYLTADLSAVDAEATAAARAETKAKREKLAKDDDGGDFAL